MKCPLHFLRPELPPLTTRLSKLPVDERGYPVPFFVKYLEGKPEFRFADGAKRQRCVQERLCWVCGQPLGRFESYVIGPMSAVNRTAAEPACHKDCAEWSVRGCPFLTKPKMERREDELTEQLGSTGPGVMIERNPGVMLIWTTRSHKLFGDGKGGWLIQVGPPESVTWWREGRPATRAEVEESITTGLPLLQAQCDGPDDLAALQELATAAMKLLPEA